MEPAVEPVLHGGFRLLLGLGLVRLLRVCLGAGQRVFGHRGRELVLADDDGALTFQIDDLRREIRVRDDSGGERPEGDARDQIAHQGWDADADAT